MLNNLHKSCINAEKKKKVKVKVHDTYPYTKTTPIQHYMATERNYPPPFPSLPLSTSEENVVKLNREAQAQSAYVHMQVNKRV